MKFTFALTFLFSSAFFLSAQVDTVQIQQHLEKAQRFFSENEYPKTIQACKNALDLLSTKKEKHPNLAADAYHLFGYAREQSGAFSEAIDAYQQAIDYYEKGGLLQQQIQSQLRMGWAYFYQKDITKSHESFQEALIILETLPLEDHLRLYLSTYSGIGVYHAESNDMDNAITYFKNVLSLCLEYIPDDFLGIASAYNSLGICYRRLNELEKAVEYHTKALEYRQREAPESLAVGWSSNNLGLCYMGLEKYEQAIRYFDQAHAIYLEAYGEDHPYIATVLDNMGICYRRMGDFKRALDHQQRGLDRLFKIYGKSHPEVSYSFRTISEVYSQMGDPEEAWNYNQKAEKSIRTYLQDLPYKNAAGLMELVAVLEDKTVQLEAKRDKKNAALDRDQLLATYQELIQVIDTVKADFQEEGSKLRLLDNYYYAYERAIRIYYEKHQQTQESENLEKAFRLAEKSKNILLLEILNAIDAQTFSGIPDSLLEKERRLKSKIASVERERFLEAEKKEMADDDKINELNQQLFELKQQKQKLTVTFEKNYPKYYRLKYNTPITALESLQQDLLQPGQTLVEYFFGVENIYAFVIDQEEVRLFQLPLERSLFEKIASFRNSIFGYFLDETQTQASYQNYSDSLVLLGHQLYDLLFAPFHSELSSNVIIIPDGILHYLPFEALIKNEVDVSTQFKTHPYVIREHIISYNYSASVMEELFRKKRKGQLKKWLGMAPRFRGEEAPASRTPLSRLNFNVPEVKTISDLTGGDVLINEAATLPRFLEKAPAYRILHLATHGKANDSSSDYSYLAFSADSSTEQLLYVRDLYNLQLSADMVVLSACETGIGDMRRGEGIISLARGFTYGGARSVIMTLWSVNDAKAARVMELFYQNLHRGKDVALQTAKQSYLTQATNPEAHPFYWAGFVAVGDMSPILLRQNRPVWLWGVLAIGIIILAWFYHKIKQKKEGDDEEA